MISRFIAGLVVGTVMAMSSIGDTRAQVIEPDLERSLQSTPATEMVPVIVVLSSKADLKAIRRQKKDRRRSNVVTTLRNHASRTQRPVMDKLQSIGAKRIRSLWITNSIAAQVPAGKVDELSTQPEVESIRLDRVLNAPATTTGTATSPEWNIGAIRAPELWALGFRGQGVVVASMDTGVDVDHPDLVTRWRGGTNSWFDPNGEHTTPIDRAGHGTQVMGLLVGGDADGTAIGVAPDAKWISVKIYNDAGQATYSVIHQGFQWLLDPDGDPLTDDAPDVVNNSWGFANNPGECVMEFEPDIQALRIAAIATVAAAGNSGPSPSTSVSTANYPENIAVGALDIGRAVGDFSSRGPSACDGTLFPELVAPGINVLTADLSFGGLPFYLTVTGTSAAAPHVSGAIALLLSAFHNAEVSGIETVLQQTALDIGDVGADNNAGYGLIDLMEAYNRLHNSIDVDGDGFLAEVDCNDNDSAIHPDAVEVKHDGVDQDCNGYDLTIDILKAEYTVRRDRLHVEAKSALGKAAKLTLTGYGPMKWNKAGQKWLIKVQRAGGDPGTVTVSGVEGAETGPTTVVGRPKQVAQAPF